KGATPRVVHGAVERRDEADDGRADQLLQGLPAQSRGLPCARRGQRGQELVLVRVAGDFVTGRMDLPDLLTAVVDRVVRDGRIPHARKRGPYVELREQFQDARCVRPLQRPPALRSPPRLLRATLPLV